MVFLSFVNSADLGTVANYWVLIDRQPPLC